MSPPHTRLTLLRCAACGSGHFDPPGITDFADLGQAREDFWRFYVEVGGGVWETLWPVLANRQPHATLLDVGCGFGFSVDAWARLGRGSAIGVELADYGRIGARMLDITVYDKLLDECEELAGRRFGVVYASEVIEHVPDPRAFVATLARYVEDDGMLVLTTPAMSFIKPDELSPTMHAALAPGFHGFLLSSEAFGRIARECGFPHVDVRVMGERQILWASRVPFSIEPGGPASFSQYLAYLESRVGSDDLAPPVWQGLAYRLAKEWSNAGKVAPAHALAERLMAVIAQAYGAHIAQPQELLQRLRSCATLEEVGRVMPYFLPNLYFHLGNLAIATKGDRALARRMYEGSVDCILELSRLGPIFFLEATSLVWPARASLADLNFMDGRIAEGVAGYARLAADGDLGSAADGNSRAPLSLIEARVPQRADELRRLKLHAPAAAIFDGYCEHIRRRYGADFLDAGGVDAALGRGSGPLPLDPLFAPWFKAMLALGSEGAGDRPAEVEAAARDVENVARRWVTHPAHGLRMRDMAEQIVAALRRNRGVVWSMSTTFKA
jgi:SAM-dependent methyltransferase